MAIQMVRTKRFLPLILPYAKSAPDVLAEQCARFAAIDFCEVSRCWRHKAAVQISDHEGVLVAPDTAAIHEIEFAEFNGRPLTPTQFSDVQDRREGAPLYISQVAPNRVTVMPWEAGGLEVSLFLKPLSDSKFGTDLSDPLFDRFNVVPEFLVTMHGNIIARGALARLLAMPDEPWTDMKMAAKYEAEFRLNCGSKFSQNIRGQQRTRMRTKASWF